METNQDTDVSVLPLSLTAYNSRLEPSSRFQLIAANVTSVASITSASLCDLQYDRLARTPVTSALSHTITNTSRFVVSVHMSLSESPNVVHSKLDNFLWCASTCSSVLVSAN